MFRYKIDEKKSCISVLVDLYSEYNLVYLILSNTYIIKS
jgi:hypothetical protein